MFVDVRFTDKQACPGAHERGRFRSAEIQKDSLNPSRTPFLLFKKVQNHKLDFLLISWSEINAKHQVGRDEPGEGGWIKQTHSCSVGTKVEKQLKFQLNIFVYFFHFTQCNIYFAYSYGETPLRFSTDICLLF